MRSAIQLISSPVELMEAEGVGHDLGRNHAALAQKIVDQWLVMRR